MRNSQMDTAANRDGVTHGFTINLSVDTLAEVDEFSDLGIAPVFVVLTAEHEKRHAVATPNGGKCIAMTSRAPLASYASGVTER